MRYLTEQEVIAINYFIIERYSPQEPKGLKDSALLNSSVERCKQTLSGVEAYIDIYEKGAALFESLAKNHCLLNANKRTAFVCLVQFLSYNGYRFVMDVKIAENFVVDTVLHRYEFNEIVEIIESHTIENN